MSQQVIPSKCAFSARYTTPLKYVRTTDTLYLMRIISIEVGKNDRYDIRCITGKISVYS